MENKKIKLLDFGDCPISTLNISKFKNFQMSAIAHYNPKLWNNDTRMKSGILYETNWEFGKTNSNEVVEFRKNIELNNKLYWLGTIYKNTGIDRYDGCRDSIPLISKFLRDKFSFNPNRLPFDQYILECCRHKLILGFGGGGGYTCGDFCLRDVELFGLEIPMIRPKFNIETIDPLIPDFHYISVNIDDCLLPNFRIKKECEEEVANRIAIKYLEVINNDTLLKYVAENSKNWYDKNMTYPNVINTVIKVLEL